MCLRYQWEYDNQDREKIELEIAHNTAIEGGTSEYEGVIEGHRDAFPSSFTPIIVRENGQDLVVPSYFGLTPAWAKDSSFGKKYAYNSRSETIMDKPTFRDPFHFRRCLIKVVSFMENLGKNRWLIISPTTENCFYIAGLYEMPNKHRITRSHCLGTVTPNDIIGTSHDRMPAILSPESRELWLSPETTPLQALELLKPCPSEWMTLREHLEDSRRGKQKYLDFGDE